LHPNFKHSKEVDKTNLMVCYLSVHDLELKILIKDVHFSNVKKSVR